MTMVEHPGPRTGATLVRCRVNASLRTARAMGVVAALYFTAVGAFAAPTDQDQVILPKGPVEKAAPPEGAAANSGVFTFAAVLLLGAAGGWMLWRGRIGGLRTLNRGSRQLAVEETRSLGNRQFLVVASYQDKKFLLGVCPGRIDLLSSLNDQEASGPKTRE